ncbi:MAG: response regulator transcription factor [Vicinamibacterales bacterium]
MVTRPIRVMCVDDHALIRDALTLKVDLQPDMRMVATAGTGEEALKCFQQHRPDVTLMDLQLPTMSGLDTIRAIRREDSEARIIVLTMYEGDEDIYRSIEAGAMTYVLKDMLADDLIRIVREVYAGARPMPADIAQRLAGRTEQGTLTRREVQVVELIATGMRNKEIAGVLNISEETVQAHVKNILAKLKVPDRTAAVTKALRRGMIHIR